MKRILIALLFFTVAHGAVVFAPIVGPIQDYSGLNRGIIGYWPLNQPGAQATDMTLNKNHGTLNGDINLIASSKGRVLDFDGTGDFIRVGTNPLLGLTQFTISGHVRNNGTGTADRLISNGGNDDFEIAINNSGGLLHDMPDGHFGVSIRNDTARYQTLGDISGSFNVWSHIVVTNKNGSQIGYVDGFQTGSSSEAFSSSDIDGAFVIGERYNGADSGWTGQFRDFRVYNRILTAAEVKQLYIQAITGGIEQ